MLKNYFVIALRQILKDKLFSAINIGGLAIGLAASMLIALFVQYELSHNDFWQNKQNLYQVNTRFNYPGFSFDNEQAAKPVSAELQQYFPEQIVNSARFTSRHPIIQVGDRLFEQEVRLADTQLAQILSFQVISGDLTAALKDTSSIALSESLANKLFGGENSLNKVIEYRDHDDVRSLKVVAVYQDLPSNSTYHFPALMQLTEQQQPGRNEWNNAHYTTLLQVTDTEAAAFIDAKLQEFIDQRAIMDEYWHEQGIEKTELMVLSLTRLDQVYMSREQNLETVNLYSLVALLILIIASFNFMNLSLARSSKRLKEVGLRKSLGATQAQIWWQFIAETYVLAVVAFVIALALVEISLPWYQAIWGKPLELDYFATSSLITAFALLSFIALLGGAYPAFVSAKYKPANVLTANQSSASLLSNGFRNFLVVAQFTASVCLIICSAVIYSQVNYSMSVERGFNKEQLMLLHGVGREPVSSRQAALKQQLLKVDIVESASYINMFPATDASGRMTFSLKQGGEQDTLSIGYRLWDEDFAQTFDQKLLAGRFFSDEYAEDGANLQSGTDTENVIVNAAALHHLGLTEDPAMAIDQLIETQEVTFRIVGVVDNTIYRSIKYQVEPEMYRLSARPAGFMAVKFKGSAATAEAQIKAFWHSQVPELPFVRTFVEDLANFEFSNEKTSASLLFSSAILAALIACLGLFGLASFTSQKRTKEIGIRKVYGASRKELIALLLWQFSKPVLIACTLGSALAFVLMVDWLEQYPYRIEASVIGLVALATCCFAFVIATLTIAGNTLKVTRANPIKALRYE